MNTKPKVTVVNPTAFVMLVDMSSSMGGAFGPNSKLSCAEAVADVCNSTSFRLLFASMAKGNKSKPLFDVAIIGYGREVGSILPFAESGFASITEFETQYMRKEPVTDPSDAYFPGLSENPVWVEPVADGGTPMAQAFSEAQELLGPWCATHPGSVPPVVINITDGQWNGDDPKPTVEELKRLSTDVGNVLVFNVHISSSALEPVVLPSDEEVLPDAYSVELFGMSSVLPEYMRDIASEQEDMDLSPKARGFCYNANSSVLTQFIKLGTTTKPADSAL